MTGEPRKRLKPLEVVNMFKVATGLAMNALELAVAEMEMDALKPGDRASAREFADAMKEACKVPGQGQG